MAGIQDRNVYDDRRDSSTVSEIDWLQKMATCYRKRLLYGTKPRLGLLLLVRFYLAKEGFFKIESRGYSFYD